MDDEYPLSAGQPWASPDPPPPEAPPRDPAWTGLEVVIIILFSLLAIVAAGLVIFLVWAIVARATGWHAGAHPEVQLVGITLLGQTAGMLAGFVLAWAWIEHVHQVRFWPAIHWRRLPPETVLGMLAGGFATMIGVQVLGHLLPMPSSVPMNQLFTHQTIWWLLIYGVVIAPFFEEFFFRGLIYPSLRSAFTTGMSGEELRRWRPLARLLGALAMVALLYWRWRTFLLGRHSGYGLFLAGAVAVVFLLLPEIPVRTSGYVVNRLARWQQPELLAILITGLLFGLMHASQLGWAWAAVLILVLVGTVLTIVRAATGSLMSSWIFHCAYNGTLFAAQYMATGGFHHFTQVMH